METNTTERTTADAVPLAHFTDEVSHARTVVGEVIEDGKRKAQRTVKHAVVAAEDCVEETTYYIKRHPWQSIGIAAGCGIGAGVLASWLVSRVARTGNGNWQREFQAVER